MKIIIKKDINEKLKAGKIIDVSDGYARNYLIPKGFAVMATDANVKAFEEIKRIKEIKVNREKQKLEKISKEIEKISLTIKIKTGADEKIFGAVTKDDIHDRLKEIISEKYDYEIMLEEPIKSLGIFKVPIRIKSDILDPAEYKIAELKVSVVSE